MTINRTAGGGVSEAATEQGTQPTTTVPPTPVEIDAVLRERRRRHMSETVLAVYEAASLGLGVLCGYGLALTVRQAQKEAMSSTDPPRDPYTDAPVPDAVAPIMDAAVDTGYFGTTVNPARGGPTPPLYLVAGPDGIVGAYTMAPVEDDDTPDLHRSLLRRMYARLARARQHAPRSRKKKRP